VKGRRGKKEELEGWGGVKEQGACRRENTVAKGHSKAEVLGKGNKGRKNPEKGSKQENRKKN